MKQHRAWGWLAGGWAAALILATLFLPALLVKRIDAGGTSHCCVVTRENRETPAVSVYLHKQGRTVQVPLEQYVRGVVAAEMPIEFSLEALKAQAIAARTYIYRRLKSGENAVVTDTVEHQAYLHEDELEQKWEAAERDANLRKLNRAIQETAGLIAVYDGEPIEAVYFSTSNGFTENAEEYWSTPVPYLRSVPSPWDAELSPKYKATVVLPYEEVARKLGLPESVPASAGASFFQILDKTAGQRVAKVRVAGKVFSGREVREKLDLRSSHFSWELKGGNVEITTYGYGHGVGMSQYGAWGMAREGKSAEEIIRYYYQGVEIKNMIP